MSDTTSYTWIKASQVGSNVRVAVDVHNQFSQNNGLYELVLAEEKVQGYLFELEADSPILRNRSHRLRSNHNGTHYSRRTDTTFSSPESAAAAVDYINNTVWGDEPTPTVITGVVHIDLLPKVAPSSGWTGDHTEDDNQSEYYDDGVDDDHYDFGK